METSKNINLQNPNPKNQEDQEKSVSMEDLPLTPEISKSTTVDHRESSTDLFEFLTSTSYDVSPAENIIFRGKLIPLNYQNTLQNLNHRIRTRSESLSALQGHKLNRTDDVARRDDNREEDEDVRLMRTSRSLDYRKRKNESPRAEYKSTTKPETTSFASGKTVRPRWYVIMFGMIKFPPEIDLKDIKNRQIRRNIPPVMFPSPVNRSSRRSLSPSPSTSWKFLNALSCKQPTSAAATAPFWVPNA